ncbi:hypothetical protein GOB25_31785 [Sinorhizobium meliloti]|nr:hypothetical protein [Sinorhizobium meliloti]
MLVQHLPRVLAFKGQTMEELGWQQPSDRTLLVPMRGELRSVAEDYLLRLDFLTGTEWPPRVIFVNPATLHYKINVDQHHLPILASREVHVQPAYQSGDGRVLQLICCSAVFQYYDVGHGGATTRFSGVAQTHSSRR